MSDNLANIEIEQHEETEKFHAVVNGGEHVTALFSSVLNAHIAGSHWAWLQGYDNFLPPVYRKRHLDIGRLEQQF